MFAKALLFLKKHLTYSWIALAFCIICVGVLEKALQQLEKEVIHLDARYQELLTQKKEALNMQHQLTRQINSQNDPAWIELILKKNLGVVPEGQLKVFFESKEN